MVENQRFCCGLLGLKLNTALVSVLYIPVIFLSLYFDHSLDVLELLWLIWQVASLLMLWSTWQKRNHWLAVPFLFTPVVAAILAIIVYVSDCEYITCADGWHGFIILILSIGMYVYFSTVILKYCRWLKDGAWSDDYQLVYHHQQ